MLEIEADVYHNVYLPIKHYLDDKKQTSLTSIKSIKKLRYLKIKQEFLQQPLFQHL